MDKALTLGKRSATGSFHLFVGVALSNIIMAVGTIILLRVISPEAYGLYAIALIPATTINLFRDWGVNSAMTKYIAQYRASGETNNYRNLVKAGLIFELLTGAILTLFSFFAANFISVVILNRPQLPSLVSLASITVLAGALLTAAQSCFVGLERMKLNSWLMVIQAVLKSLIAPFLVLVGYGALGALLGYTLALVAACIIGVLLLYYLIFIKNSTDTQITSTDFTESLKTLLRYGIPFSLSSIISGFMAQFYSFMMAANVNDLMIGNYSSALQFNVILTFLTVPISTVLFPAFAQLSVKDEKSLLKTTFVSSIKYTSLLLVPATLAMMVLSEPLVFSLFGEKWVYTPLFLSLYVINYLFSCCGELSMNALLAGQGETKILLKQNVIVLLVGVPLAVVLIPNYGVLGVILGNLIAGIPGMLWVLYWILKHYNVVADFRSSAKILVASVIAATITYLLINFLSIAEWIRLLIGGISFLAVYILVAPVIGAITQSDVENLKVMFSGQGIFTKIINIPLYLFKKVIALRRFLKR